MPSTLHVLPGSEDFKRSMVANKRRKHDLVGCQLSILGTTHPVAVGFMLYAFADVAMPIPVSGFRNLLGGGGH